MTEDSPVRAAPVSPCPSLLLPDVGGLERAIVASTPALVCVIDSDVRIALFNPALEIATGWAAAEVLGRPFCEVLAVPGEADRIHDAVTRAIATGLAPPQEGDWRDRWGGSRRVSMQNSVLHDETGRPVALVCVGTDVTQRRLLEAQLHERANSDALTGLRNRAALLVALEAELSDRGSPGCALLFCDLDGFKQVNDQHGHDAGDRLLRDVAARLLEVTGLDDVVARMGGDEFVVLSPRAAPWEAAELSSRIGEAVGRSFATRHGLVTLGISVGIAIGGPGDAADQLLAAADRHMYGVKVQRRQGA
ncbi:MAG TPA: diguanylate cyclase [Mycobacteriales bacterium]|jgi:cyclic di-GMP phosphodiesterase Gmr|nr:diguanylate cyclase [Mycobacteriales bacterium]